MTNTSKTRPLLIVAVAMLGAAAWYLFRPELLLIDKHANDAAPTIASAVVANVAGAEILMPAPILARGQFTSDAHETTGRATLQRTATGVVLRLEGFATSNGPDVRVYLVAADSVGESRTVKRAAVVDLGALRGNIGDQNYLVPADVDLSRYRSVSIWCRRFSVNFGSAVLRAEGS